MRRWTLQAFILGVLVAVAALAVRVIIVARDYATVIAADRFAAARQDATLLRAFLQRMPKGGDLHVHLSGAVYAETLIDWAVADGLCVRLADLTIVDPPCDRAQGTAPVSETRRDQDLYDRIVNALSMRFFVRSPAMPSGHDQFFSAFARMGVSTRRGAELTADLLRQYQAQNVHYTEIMMTFLAGDERRRLDEAVRGMTDPAAMLDAMKAAGLDRIVAAMRARIAEQVAHVEAALACDAVRSQPGCGVTYRYIAQVGRNNPLEDVFVQTAAAAALVRAEPRVVALNYVQPEDYQIARRDYAAQMRMVAFLASDIPVALHAGELWLGLVPPEDLAFHITDAVLTAGARRIGHGTGLAFELNVEGLLATMRDRSVAIEISLTSSDLILGVRGRNHPLRTYLAAGVPVVLSTDDAGVSRIDLTNEYVRAAREHRLGYRTLKAIARNALVHSFLADDDKRRELERYDAASAAFERSLAGRRFAFRNLVALVRAAVLPAR